MKNSLKEKLKNERGVSIITILLIILILAVIGGVGYFYVTEFMMEDKETEKETVSQTQETPRTNVNPAPAEENIVAPSNNGEAGELDQINSASKLNGVFSNGTVTIKIYLVKNNKAYYVATSDSNYISGNGDISNDTSFVEDDFGETKVKIDATDTGIKVESTKEDLPSGDYAKQSAYSKEEFFKEENFGDPQYLNSTYNGLYKLDDRTIEMYQDSATTVRIEVVSGSTVSSLSYEIRQDGTLYGKIFESEYLVTLNGDTLTFKTQKGEDGDKFDGVYTKTGQVTMDYLIQKKE